MVSSPTSQAPILGTHIVIDRAGVIAVAIRATPTRVIPRINIRATEMQRILCSHVMVAAEGSGIRALRPVTVIRNRGTSEDNRKCGGSDNSEFRHAFLPLVRVSQKTKCRRER